MNPHTNHSDDVSLDDPYEARPSIYFHPTEGQTFRAVLAWVRAGGTTPRFSKVSCHYKEGFGFVETRIGKDGPEADHVWESLGPTRVRFATILCLYSFREGKLDAEKMKTSPEVVIFDFPDVTFERLRDLQTKHGPLSLLDLKIKCSAKRRVDFEVIGDAVLRKNLRVWELVQERVKMIEPKARPCKQMSTSELATRLGVPWVDPTVTQAVDDFIAHDSGSV